MAPVGPPLGVVAGEEYRPARVRLGIGDVLVLFTDGLVEDAARSYDVGLATVLDTLGAGPVDDIEALADRLLTTAVDMEHLARDPRTGVGDKK